MDTRDAVASNNEQAMNAGQKYGKKTVGGVAVVVLIAAYSFIQPVLNQRMGWNLPALRQDSNGQIVADSNAANDRQQDTVATPAKTSAQESAVANRNAKTVKPPAKSPQQQPAAETPAKQESAGEPKLQRGPLANRMSPGKSVKTKSPRGPPATSQDKSELRYGLLREIGPERYISPAGLQYGPGSSEGHRLEHLRRHLKDIPGRPVHGVFDGEMEAALKTIDQAYAKAKRGVRTTKQVDDRRTIYTVDMGKRIGFSGGKQGARKRNPMLRRVRLVLEGTQVITAFPVP